MILKREDFGAKRVALAIPATVKFGFKIVRKWNTGLRGSCIMENGLIDKSTISTEFAATIGLQI